MRIYEFFKPCSIIYVKSWFLMKKNIRFYLERSEFVFYICGVLIN